MAKTTPWFPTSITPVRVGVYQLRLNYPGYPPGRHALRWSYWDGTQFMCSADRAGGVGGPMWAAEIGPSEDAVDPRYDPHWRGLEKAHG